MLATLNESERQPNFMLNARESITEANRLPPPVVPDVVAAKSRRRFTLGAIPRIKLLSYGFADQALTVGGGFLLNVALARTQTKEEYGMFALSYSLFILFSGMHNAAILEPYTVYASGRYREHFAKYLRLMVRSNAIIGAAASGLLLLACLLLFWFAPQLVSKALVGLAVTVGILLTGPFVRRTFYLQREPAMAARTSLVFFITVCFGLWLTIRAHRLDSFSVFLILALGWIVGGASSARRLGFDSSKGARPFMTIEPHYWKVHWRYARWVLVTACVFQLTNQGYYWIVAGFLSVKEVAELRAMYLLIAPAEQISVALSLLVLPVLAAHYAACRTLNFFSLWSRYAMGIVAVGVTFALVVRMAGRQAMHAAYGGEFDSCAALLFALALVPLLMGIGNTMNDALKAAEKPRFVFYAYLCSGAATFLGGIPLVSRFGLRGAVYGLLLSAGTYSAAMAAGFVYVVSARRANLRKAETLA
jgi:O-antigen/teichoic acid export membrane protein